MGAPETNIVPDQEKYLELRPGLFRCTLIFSLGPVNLPVATFLIKGHAIPGSDGGHEWLMVDAGVPHHAQQIVKTVEEVLKHPKDTLKYLCITHAHMDHTGASMVLLERYPECKVVSHVEEKTFLCDGKSFKSCVGDTWIFNIMKHLMASSKIRIPEEKMVLLREGEQWEYSGLFEIIETRGHTPGSISFLHVPTRSMMIGDASRNHMFLKKLPDLSYPLSTGTSDMGTAVKSMDKIISMKSRVDTIFPAHDYNHDGVTMADFEYLRTSDPR
ncbi:hypothetical protein BGZ83_002574 [Gryganskiella cystojenkinii]|nr:hypothetical protein BGZ83_002574 [Gryganskiella cystojenkinii]